MISYIDSDRRYEFANARYADGLGLDPAAMKEAQRQQSRTERRLRAITDNLPVLITDVDPDERDGFADLTMRDWLGIDPAAAIGRQARRAQHRSQFADGAAGRSRGVAGVRRCRPGARRPAPG